MPAKLAVDGKTDGNFENKSVTHTKAGADPWWEVDLKSAGPVDRGAIWNRTDNELQVRLSDFRITLLDEARRPTDGRIVLVQQALRGRRSVEEVHEVTGNVLPAMAVLHAGAALFHHYVMKDGLMLRMMPRRQEG